MKINFYALLLILLLPLGALAQTDGDYRTRFNVTGEWTSDGLWQIFQNGMWVNTPTYPTNASGNINVRSAVTLTGVSLIVDQLNLATNGKITVNSDAELRVLLPQNGNQTQLNLSSGAIGIDVYGVFINEEIQVSGASPSKFIIKDGGTYIHRHASNGIIPQATWEDGSTIRIEDLSDINFLVQPDGLEQQFYNVEISTSQNRPLNLDATLQNIRGNLNIISTGNSRLYLAEDFDYSLTIGGDLYIRENAYVVLASIQDNATINIGGSFILESNRPTIFTDYASITLTIAGDFIINGNATHKLITSEEAGEGNVTIAIAGDVDWQNGGLVNEGSGTANLRFTGSQVQRYQQAGSFAQNADINYIIGTSAGSPADVDLGTSALTGGGSLTLVDNSNLRLGSTDPVGALQLGTAGGNIQLAGERNWGNNNTIYYNASSPQVIGNGYPDTSPVNLSIANPTSVSLTDNLILAANSLLNLLDGRLSLGEHTLTINGGLTAAEGVLESTTASSLVIGGSGVLGPLPFYDASPVIGSVRLNRNSNNGGLALGSDLTIASSLELEAGQLIMNGYSLTLQGDINRASGSLTSSNDSELYVEGSGDATLPFSSATAANFLRILSINRTNGAVDLQNTVIVQDTLFLLNGVLNNLGTVEMATNSAVYRSGGSLNEAPRAVSHYDVIYGASLTTGDELPSTENGLRNLIVNANGPVQLDRAVSINGDLQLLDGALAPGEFDITLAGNLLVNAPLLEGSNTFVFEGSSQVRGSEAPAFYHLQISASADVEMVDIENITVAGNWTNNGGQYVGNTSIVTFNGQDDQSIRSNTQPFGHVVLEGSGIKALVDNALVGGDLTIGETATLDLAANQISLFGNWINLGGVLLSGEAGQGRGSVLLSGADQTILSADQPFGNLLLGGTGTKRLLDELYVAGDLTISTGSVLDVNTAETDGIGNAIYLGGNWENNGLFLAGQSTLTLNGNVTQLLGGSSVTDFNNLDITNTASPGARAISNQNLLGYMQLGPGVRFVPDGGNGSVDFTLVSSGDRTTASIAALPAGASIDGQVVVQRYMTSHGYIFRYIATPVVGATVIDWADDMTINLATSAIPTMYLYREEVPGPNQEGWQPYPNSLSEPLELGRGYSVEIWENRTQPVVADIKGLPHQGDIEMPVSFTDDASQDDITEDGWNLLGNPYPSAIDWTSIYSNPETSKLEPVVWISDNRSGVLQYVSYNAEAGVGLGASGASPYIASGQAFWVNAIGTNPRLVIKEENKASVAEDAQFYRKKQPEDVLVVGLSRGKVRDETALVFRDNTTAGYDEGFDSYKLKNQDFSLSSLGQNWEDLAYNFMPWFSCVSEVPLYIEHAKAGTYTFDFNKLETFTKGVTFTLLDQLTGQSVTVAHDTRYTFSITKEPKTFSWDRFKLQVSYEALQLDRQVEAPSVCSGSDALVFIEDAQADVFYQAHLGGHPVGDAQKGLGGKLELKIPAAQLTAGEHILTIKAQRGDCEPLSLAHAQTLTVNELPALSKVSGGSTCGEGTVTLTAEGATEGASYRWYESQEAPSPLAETSTGSFITPVLSQSSWFWVSLVNAAGCEGARMKVAAEVKQGDKPEISEAGGILQARGSGTFQWYLNNEPISGATGAQLEATQTGTYSVSLTKEGCETFSDAFVFEALGLEELEKLGISLWPNPFSDELQLKFTDKHRPHTIRIYSISGTLVKTVHINSAAANDIRLNLGKLSSGLYLLEFQMPESNLRTRIIKR